MKTIKEIQDNITKLIEGQRKQSTSDDALFIGTAIFGVQLTLIEIRDILNGEEIERYMRDRELITLEAHRDIVNRLEDNLGVKERQK